MSQENTTPTTTGQPTQRQYSKNLARTPDSIGYIHKTPMSIAALPRRPRPQPPPKPRAHRYSRHLLRWARLHIRYLCHRQQGHRRRRCCPRHRVLRRFLLEPSRRFHFQGATGKRQHAGVTRRMHSTLYCRVCGRGGSGREGTFSMLAIVTGNPPLTATSLRSGASIA